MTTPFIKLSVSEGKHLEALLQEAGDSLANGFGREVGERCLGWAKRLRKKHTFGTSEGSKILGANH